MGGGGVVGGCAEYTHGTGPLLYRRDSDSESGHPVLDGYRDPGA